MNRKSRVILAAICALWSQPVLAGASNWSETDGARLRFVTENPAQGAETLRSILQIKLGRGWKTYWREPGASGIPPMVNIASGASGAEIHFPIPHWVDDSYGSWAGYTEPVSLPVTFTLEDGASEIAADVFLGICRDVCVPVSAHFEIPLSDTKGGGLQAIQVRAAYGNLPKGNSQALSISDPAWTEDGMLEFRVTHEDAADEAELFLAGGASHGFRKPQAVASGASETVFHAEPLFDPDEAGAFDLTAAVRHGALSAEVKLLVPAR